MNVLLIANEEQKEELLLLPADNTFRIHWIRQPGNALIGEPADACIDLMFENSMDRISWLKGLGCPLTMINSVVDASLFLEHGLIRINGWNTFLKRKVVEATCPDILMRQKTEEFFAGFARKIEWVADIPGFITPRVIASIINEAFFALQEKVSSREGHNKSM